MIFKRTVRESKSHRRSAREDTKKKKKESLIFFSSSLRCIACSLNEEEPGVVRLFCVLVSLVFVGGWMCGYESEETVSLLFLLRFLKKKFCMLKFERKCRQSSFVAWWCKRVLIREEREKFL